MPDAGVKVAQTAAIADPAAKEIDNESVDYGGTTRHRQRVVTPGAKTAAVTAVAHPGATTKVNLLVLNAARRGFRVRNTSSDVLYLKFGDNASAADHTDVVAPGDTFREPDGGYAGLVTGAFETAVATGGALVTELTT
jgi:hypothetical protein